MLLKGGTQILKRRLNTTNMFFKPLLKSTSKSFSLYIPKKELQFINHPKYGRVYPVYIADEDYNKKENPKKIMPLMLLLTGFNLYMILTGMQILPMSDMYYTIYTNANEIIFLTSAFINYYLLRKYFKFLSNYSSRVKAFYLLPSGDKVILETFDGSVKRFENIDIFESNVRNKFEDIRMGTIKWNPLLVTNDNNFMCQIKWGRYTENFFEGKRKFIDFEIFSEIISRNNIDTKIEKFRNYPELGVYTPEDKKKVLSYFGQGPFGQRTWVKKIDRNRLCYHYKLLRFRYGLGNKKLTKLKEEYKLFD